MPASFVPKSDDSRRRAPPLVDKPGPNRIFQIDGIAAFRRHPILQEDSTMVMLGTDMKVAETPKDGLKDFQKRDAYEEWLEARASRSTRSSISPT
jgi:hypothetical protein